MLMKGNTEQAMATMRSREASKFPNAVKSESIQGAYDFRKKDWGAERNQDAPKVDCHTKDE